LANNAGNQGTCYDFRTTVMTNWAIYLALS
jgi:hypothetical protein